MKVPIPSNPFDECIYDLVKEIPKAKLFKPKISNLKTESSPYLVSNTNLSTTKSKKPIPSNPSNTLNKTATGLYFASGKKAAPAAEPVKAVAKKPVKSKSEIAQYKASKKQASILVNDQPRFIPLPEDQRLAILENLKKESDAIQLKVNFFN